MIKLKTTDDELNSLIAKWFRDSTGRGEHGRQRRTKNAQANEDPVNPEDSGSEADANSGDC